MRELNKQDIMLNNVDTISQYKILEYLKEHLNIDEFKIYLVNKDNIKVVDTNKEYLYFNYNKVTKKVSYQDELVKEKDYEIGM